MGNFRGKKSFVIIFNMLGEGCLDLLRGKKSSAAVHAVSFLLDSSKGIR